MLVPLHRECPAGLRSPHFLAVEQAARKRDGPGRLDRPAGSLADVGQRLDAAQLRWLDEAVEQRRVSQLPLSIETWAEAFPTGLPTVSYSKFLPGPVSKSLTGSAAARFGTMTHVTVRGSSGYWIVNLELSSYTRPADTAEKRKL